MSVLFAPRTGLTTVADPAFSDSPSQTERSSFGTLGAILRRWPLLLVLALAGGVIGFLLFSWQKAVYESTTRIQVSKRFDQNSEGRTVYLEDYVATMTQIIASDAVLGEAANSLDTAQLTVVLPEDKTARLDVLKNTLAIVRVRDPNAVTTTSSSVLTLKYASGDPEDTRKILEAVIVAVQKYLDRGFSDALRTQQDDLTKVIARRRVERDALFTKMNELRRDLSVVTTEELPLIRGRISAGYDRVNTLKQDQFRLARDLKAIASTGMSPAARILKLRLLLGTTRTPGEANGPSAAETLLAQLSARRAELSERMGKDHPTLKELDSQIQFYKELTGRAPIGTAEVPDELAFFGERQRELKEVVDAQLATATAQLEDDQKKVREGSKFQDQMDLLRRQLDELAIDIAKQEDRLQSIVQMEQREANSRRAYDARVLDKPRVGRKIGPSLATWVAPALLLGLLLGAGLAFLAEWADQGFRNPAEIRTRLGVPVFGHVPQIRKDLVPTADISASYDASLVVGRRPKSVEAELYRSVRAQLLVSATAGGLKLFQFTSPNPGDGKSTTAANIAIALAQVGKKVVLIDADFRKPRVHTLFALGKDSVGLASVVEGKATIDEALRGCDVDNLSLLSCGPRPANPAELLASERFGQTLDALKTRFDYVIIDTPPLLVVSDPLVVAQWAEAVVLVCRITRRSRPETERARELLADAGGAKLVGVVVNGAEGANSGYQTGYKYGYEYQYTEKYTDDTAG